MNNYQTLEKEIKNKTAQNKYSSWRGDLSRSSLDKIVFGDLNNFTPIINNKTSLDYF